MKYDWWIWESELSDEVVDGIVERCEKFEVIDAVVGSDNPDGEYDESMRISKVRWADDDSELKEMIWNYGQESNGAAFGFDIINKFNIQYTTYHGSDSGFYDWHRDNVWKKEGYYDRKISLIIQLTDPSEYEGGNFEFEIGGVGTVSPEGFKKKGSIIAFPSFMKHRVTEVTKGKRNSIVSWIQGPHFR
jgi:PKHD-type hydroxylase